MKREKLAAVFFGAAIVLGLAASAGAVDGTIEINQASIGGVFPYTIGASGSYRLTGNIQVPSSTFGILVNAKNVTIDLNGFSITGPTDSNGIAAGSGFVGTTVENGTVTGFNQAIILNDNSTVKSVHADSNAKDGITVGSNSLVEDCTANSNLSGKGISCNAGCTISGNTLNNNKVGVIVSSMTASLIVRNTINGNTTGLFLIGSNSGYGENVLNGNTADSNGGTSMKNNVCNGVLC